MNATDTMPSLKDNNNQATMNDNRVDNDADGMAPLPSPRKMGTVVINRNQTKAGSGGASVVSTLSSDISEADREIVVKVVADLTALQARYDALYKANAAMSRSVAKDDMNGKNNSCRSQKELEELMGADVLDQMMVHARFFRRRYWLQLKCMPKGWQRFNMQKEKTICYTMMKRFKGVYPNNMSPQWVWSKWMVPLLTSLMHEWRTQSIKKMTDQIMIGNGNFECDA